MISIHTFYFSQKKKKQTEYWVRQLEQQFGFFFAPEGRRWCRRRKQTGLHCVLHVKPVTALANAPASERLAAAVTTLDGAEAKSKNIIPPFAEQFSPFRIDLFNDLCWWNACLKHSCNQTIDVSYIVWMKATEIIWQQTGSPQQGRSNGIIFLSGLKNIWKLIIEVTTRLPTVETLNLLIFHTKITFSPHRVTLTYKRQIWKCSIKILKICGIMQIPLIK